MIIIINNNIIIIRIIITISLRVGRRDFANTVSATTKLIIMFCVALSPRLSGRGPRAPGAPRAPGPGPPQG